VPSPGTWQLTAAAKQHTCAWEPFCCSPNQTGCLLKAAGMQLRCTEKQLSKWEGLWQRGWHLHGPGVLLLPHRCIWCLHHRRVCWLCLRLCFKWILDDILPIEVSVLRSFVMGSAARTIGVSC
jgi:hypothetical protein